MDPPGIPARFRGRLVEVARREWLTADEFDIAELTGFLRSCGLRCVDSLASSSPALAGPVGAAVLLSGDLRPAHARSRPKRSPAPGVPAACAVVFGETDQPGAV